MNKSGQVNVDEQLYFLDTIFENIPQMIFVKDAKDLRFVRFNRAGEELLGLKREVLLGKSDFDFFPKEQAQFFVDKDRLVLSSGKLEVIEEEPIDTPRGRRLLRTKKITLKNTQGEPAYLLGISEDITDFKETQARMVQSSKMAALGEMSSGIAHEINNPLAILLGYADNLGAHLKENEPAKQILNKMESTIFRIAKIVNGLRNFSHSGGEEEHKKIQLQTLIQDTLDFCLARFKSHQVDLKMDFPQEDVWVLGNEVQLSQVLLNLLNNAFDALVDPVNPVENSQFKKGRIDLQLAIEGELAIIQVKDNGSGIDSQVQKKIFQPFFTTKSVGKGSGLGLSICKGIVESHSGHIYFESSDSGSVFWFTLPLYKKSRSSQSISNARRAHG